MNTTVITSDPHDWGAGKDARVEFRDCKWKVDDQGWLHVYSPTSGPVAAFAPGAVTAVTNGSIHEAGIRVAAVKL